MRRIYLILTVVFAYGANSPFAQANKVDSLKRAGNYNEALAVCQQNIEKDLKEGDNKELYEDYNEIANIYQVLGEYRKSTDYYYKALKLSEEADDKRGIGIISYNISQNFGNMHEYNAALPYIERAIEVLGADTTYDQIVADGFTMLGVIHAEKKDYKNAELVFEKAIKRFNTERNEPLLANLCVNFSDLMTLQGKYTESKKNGRLALGLFKKHNDKLGIAVAYINMQVAHYFDNVGNKKAMMECVELLDSALMAIENIDSPEHYLKIYENKSELYQAIGNADSSLKYLKAHYVLKDSVYTIEKQKQIQELRIQYEADKKEKDNEVLAAQNKNKSYLIIIIITGGALVVSVLLLILVRNNSRKKQKEMEFERNKLELEQKTLRAQMNPHFMFNAINGIQCYILKKNEQEAYDYLAKFSKLMRIVLNNSQEKVLMLSQELEMIRLYVEMEQLRFEDGFDFEVKIGKEVNENETKVPAMLIQPYIENAIWHGLMNLKDERDGILKLEINSVGNELRIVIEDNGIGREKAKTYNTDEKHKSAGMKLTEQRLMMINKMQEYGSAKVKVTDLYDDNKKGIGTRVDISLPVDGK